MHTQRARQIGRTSRLMVRPSPPSLTATFVVLVVLVVLPLLLLAGACSTGSEDAAVPTRPGNTIRSSGELFNSSEDDGGLQAVRPENPDASGLVSDELDTFGDADQGLEGLIDETSELPAASPSPRLDGIELVFLGGRLGPIAPGSTIEEIGDALGPLYIIEEEPFIRIGFERGYSVSREGEVRFWAVEEDGIITMIMTTHPTVGLESGLRPTMAIDDAVALHGPPVLTIGSESREFAVFADGTGAAQALETETPDAESGDAESQDTEPQGEGDEVPADPDQIDVGAAPGQVVVLVAIGRFGGPVGIYQGAVALGAETSEFLREDATIKELWFPLG